MYECRHSTRNESHALVLLEPALEAMVRVMMLIVLCSLLLGLLHGGIFYVATDGLNTNPGTIGQPWHTISYAASTLSGIGAGDTIIVRAGNYPEVVEPDISGTANAPILLRNRPNEVVTLNPGRFRFNDGINYWKVCGFITLNSDASGFKLSGNHVIGGFEVDSCAFSHHAEDGVYLGGPDFGGISIENCIIEWNGEVNGVPTGQEGDGIIMYGLCGKLWARRNLIANNWAKGISHASEGEFKGDSSVVDSNLFLNNFETGMDFCADNSYIRYNYFSSNGIRDPEAGEWGDAGLSMQGPSSGNIIAFNVIKGSGQIELWPGGNNNNFYNNTVIKDHYYTTVPGSPYATCIMFFDGNGSGSEFRNNIVMNILSQPQHHFAIISEVYERYIDQVWSNNLYWCPNATSPDPENKAFKLYNAPGLGGMYKTLVEVQSTWQNQEIGSVYDNPDFVSYADSNFNLAVGSPAIDAGIDVGFPYYGDAPDMGAFEFNPAGIFSFEESPNNGLSMQVYPNPFKQMTDIRWQITDNGPPITDNRLHIEIYEVTGRLVRQYDDATMRLFDHIVWQGTDDIGQKLPAGVYFCRLTNDEFSITEKTIKLR